MFNLDPITNENNKDHNKKWPYIPDYPYKMLLIGPSGSGNTNALLNLIKEQDNYNFIDKIYLYAKDLSDPKYQFIIKKRQNVGIKHLNDPNTFIEYSNTTDDVYSNFDDYNPSIDIMTNKKFQTIIKELFIRCRKLSISLIFIIQSYFSVPK